MQSLPVLRVSARTRARRVLAAVVVGTAAVAAATSPSRAGDERTGTSGAVELLIPVGPRGTALGGVVASDAGGIEAAFWNPAGLTRVERTQAMFSHTRYFAGMAVNYAAAGTTIGGFGSLAVNAKVLSIGELIETTEDAPDGTGAVASPTFTVLGVSYARQFIDRVNFGATMNYIDERVLGSAARGVAFDFGVQYQPAPQGFRFGIVMKNFGPSMRFTGPGFELQFHRPDQDPAASNRAFFTESAPFELPSYFVLAATYDLTTGVDSRLALMSAFQNNNFSGDTACGGVEWTYRDLLALRGSYFASFSRFTDPVTGETGSHVEAGDDLYTGYALGAGLTVPAGASAFTVDAAWRPVRDYFDDTLEFALGVTF